MKKQKGFTLMELLAVMVILGITLAIAIPAYGAYMKSAKNQAFKEAEETMRVAASDALTQCMASPPSNLISFCEKHEIPSNQQEHDIITGVDLIKYEYMDAIANPENTDIDCDMENSYVYISNRVNSENVNNSDLIYKVCLICGNKKSKDCEDGILRN